MHGFGLQGQEASAVRFGLHERLECTRMLASMRRGSICFQKAGKAMSMPWRLLCSIYNRCGSCIRLG